MNRPSGSGARFAAVPRRLLAIAVLLAAAVAACGPSPAQVATPAAEAWFEDVTAASGVRVEPLRLDRYFMPTLMGGGVAVLDIDQDGRLDLFFPPAGDPDGEVPARLYRQRPDATFEDVTHSAGLDIAGHGQGVAVGDVNNDGWPDLVVTGYRQTWLLLNAGDGTFVDVSAEAGVDNPNWGVSAAFIDVDRDGWLDLVVANYLRYDDTKPCMDDAGQRDFCGPFSFDGVTSRLFRNRGVTQRGAAGAAPARVVFDDVSVEAGLAAAPGAAMGVVVADVDGDHWPDFLIANDSRPNHLWINQRDGTFREEAVLRGVAYNAVGRAEANMGIAIGDADGNGLFDLFITHLTDETHRLWSQVERGIFTDATAAAGLTDGPRSTGFGAAFADIDQDGAEDLVVVNGRVSRPRETVASASATVDWAPYAEGNLLYRNIGPGRFEDISAGTPDLTGTPGVYRAVVAADLDNDGALDLVVTRLDGAPRLLRNVAPARGHWVLARTVDPALRRDAQGAVVTVVAGGRRWRRSVHPSVGYLSSGDPRAHVGLGAADRIDAFEVRWPDGVEETFPGTSADQIVTLEKGMGRAR